MKHPFLVAILVAFLGILVGVLYFLGTSPSLAQAATARDYLGLSSQRVDPDAKLTSIDQAILGSPEAKQYLKTLWGRGSSCGITPDESIGKLDPKFAQCAAAFFKAYGPVKINSAYRSTSQQACVCSGVSGLCAPPGKSKHQRGIAIDVSPVDGNFPRLHRMAKQYGLCFNLGSRDKVHLIPASAANTASQQARCAGASNYGQCGSGFVPPYDPNYNPNSISQPYQQQASQSLADQLSQDLESPSGGDSGGGSSGLGGATPFSSEPYYLDEIGGEVGTTTDDGFLGDGVGFEELFGDFGEFGEGEEARELSGFNSSTSTEDGTVQVVGGNGAVSAIRSFLSPSAQSGQNGGACLDGILTPTIFGTVCKRSSDLANEETPESFVSTTFSEGSTMSDVAEGGVTVLAQYINPIRHLIGDTVSTDQYRYDSSSDTYRNNERFAYDSGGTGSLGTTPTPADTIGSSESPEILGANASGVAVKVVSSALLVVTSILKSIFAIFWTFWLFVNNTFL